jgi:hypothetical protein
MWDRLEKNVLRGQRRLPLGVPANHTARVE